jgi:hypothetical protein
MFSANRQPLYGMFQKSTPVNKSLRVISLLYHMLSDIPDMPCHRHNPFADEEEYFQLCATGATLNMYLSLPRKIEMHPLISF